MRLLFTSALLFAAFTLIHANDKMTGEYWIDSEYASHSVITGMDTCAYINVPIENIKPGLHFLNFRAFNMEGEAGLLFRTMFYVYDDKSDAAPTSTECWIDDNYVSRLISDSKPQSVFSTDISNLNPGVHFFNCRSITNNGIPGKLYRTMFFIQENAQPEVAGYEYWFDGDSTNTKDVNASGREILLSIDLSNFSLGEHTLHIQMKDSFGRKGPEHTEKFIVDLITNIEEIVKDSDSFNIYNLSGYPVMKDAKKEDLHSLPQAIYIINGHKVLIDKRKSNI